MTYQRKKAEVEQADYKAEQMRLLDPEYQKLVEQLEKARSSAHMTSLW